MTIHIIPESEQKIRTIKDNQVGIGNFSGSIKCTCGIQRQARLILWNYCALFSLMCDTSCSTILSVQNHSKTFLFQWSNQMKACRAKNKNSTSHWWWWKHRFKWQSPWPEEWGVLSKVVWQCYKVINSTETWSSAGRMGQQGMEGGRSYWQSTLIFFFK